MIRRIAIAVSASVLSLTLAAGATLAAPNPSLTGQPNQSCQVSSPPGPPGLLSTTNGFATRAVIVYAGTPGTAHSLASGNSLAVSQYDVACFQVSQH